LVRARVLRELDQPLQAVQDYAHASSLVPYPTPVLMIEQAEALVEAGEAYVDLAIQSLDAAIRKYGPLILLESCAIDVDVERQHYDAALIRIDRVLNGMTRKEKWFVRRGEVLQKAGRIEEAGATYEDALKAIESLPGRLQQIPASQVLVAYIHDLLERGNF
jgi:predicted Zn-dependent protease